ncbi:hypothetical protein [Haloarcula marismortui]|uniref:hypothetical protein n=1 Tax=Haloarcula marismortui TaxID=2238 RepID=UPI000320CF12|nr:hypothetical protein [Haloarcula marismortui]
MGRRYHVVCHECAFEGLYEDASVAEGQRDAHTSDSGHRMSLRDISCQEAPGLSQ